VAVVVAGVAAVLRFPAGPFDGLLALALPLLAAGPAVVYLVPEEQAWQVALQAVAASTFVSRLQGSSS